MSDKTEKDEQLVEVYRARDSIQAHLFAAELEEDGIECQVFGDPLGIGLGGNTLGWSTAPQIFVKEKDALRARELLSEYEQLLLTNHDRMEDDEEDSEEFDDPENEEETEE